VGVISRHQLAQLVRVDATANAPVEGSRQWRSAVAVAVKVRTDIGVERRLTDNLRDQRNLPGVRKSPYKTRIALVARQFQQAAEGEAVRPVGTDVAVAGEQVVVINHFVEARESRERIGASELVAIREPLVNLDVQRCVSEVGAAFGDVEASLRTDRLRVARLGGRGT